MIKSFILSKYTKKIKKNFSGVNVVFNREIPTPSIREIYQLCGIVSKVNSFEKELLGKDEVFFKEKTLEFKRMIKGKTQGLNEEEAFLVIEDLLEDILPFYFAMVREAARRTIRMRHFDVQILGGIILHRNKIAEMATGEGKTLVATLAASLNALIDSGVHIVTVNDYLAKRDWEWMGPVYRFLGLSVGVIQQDMGKDERKQAYSCDITYGTNNEFGFDYLRDNMATSLDEVVQRGHFYAIVDEVDSILIDEARTPLIISGPSELSVDKYYIADRITRQLKINKIISAHDTKEGTVIVKLLDGSERVISRDELENNWDAIVEEKNHNSYLTKRGEEKCEALLRVNSISEDAPDQFSNTWVHYITNAIKAHNLFTHDKDYIVKDGKVIIVDEFTGRLMPGRRWSEGIHQAIEAKEHLEIQQESQTLATITLQNYFRMYKKLAGMTGTAYTEANEFKHIYKLDVVTIPTNKPLIRTNFSDRIYKTKKAKFKAIISEIEELYRLRRPVLVGTTSIEDSEELSFILKKKGIPHNVLNAKYHEREAYIVAQAGRLGQVTIATNMAGRGTDIILGGNIDYFIKEMLMREEIYPEDNRYTSKYNELYYKYKDKFEEEHRKVVELGGLHVIGAQRHEARRIDNQLKGRAGRQGDPGSSRFYISLDDELMRLFGSERIYFLMDKLGFPEDEPIEHPLVTRSIETAQKRVEAHNFEIRKNLLQFDDVMNRQRETIYKQRREILEKDNIKEEIYSMMEELIENNINIYYEGEPDLGGLVHWLKIKFAIEIDVKEITSTTIQQTSEFIIQKLKSAYEEREKIVGSPQMRIMEKMIALFVIDSRWKEHLLVIDSLKEGISLRGYAHVDPIVEYQKESYLAFSEMMDSIKEGIVELLFRTKLAPLTQTLRVFPSSEQTSKLHSSPQNPLSTAKGKIDKRDKDKVGRNDPCPCGSGKKYKKCCGA
ncbi:MAG: preprotein translocase subunit SecA [Candidatus Omnitrophica bacterium]|nr:preprotein translocase subunit SecA [Candidatus Omnitrophota bacterium]MCM8827136.1 preprotein translocase subunit SecA [Candidatus Omnitrophota bacterium]